VRVFIILIAICAVPPAANAQTEPRTAPEASEYLTRALDVMQSRSIHAAKLDWPKIRESALRIAAGAKTPAETYAAIRAALKALGDNHSFLRPAIVPGGPPDSARGAIARPPAHPEARRIDGIIGYIRIPEFAGADSKSFASEIIAAIRDVDGSRLCGWVIDLRGNGGGNMWPMLAGLSPILGRDSPGSFVFPNGYQSRWQIDVKDLAPYDLETPDPFVAVLHDKDTASSGEAVAVAFRGRARARSFGQPTRGLSTANDSIALPDGAMLFLTVGVYADRTGATYGGPLEPDEAVPGEAALDRAVSWLRRDGCVELFQPPTPKGRF
jgi:carboxyl-terminal processing protease